MWMQEMCTMETHNRGNRIYGQRGNKYKIKESIDCKITDIFYCIYCTKCKKNIHIAQTRDCFYQQMNLNLKIRTYKMEDPIAKYFCTIDHSMEHYKVIGIEKVH